MEQGQRCDFAVIGGGIVGLATAWQLAQQRPGAAIALLEKEPQVAMHQTGHNSGVIHAGIYYPPDSFKARLCREGLQDTISFCREHGLPMEQCGKLIVATGESERNRLRRLYERGKSNQLDISWLEAAELTEREPNIRGVAAVHVPATGIVDYPAMCRRIAGLAVERGVEIRLNEEVAAIEEREGGVTLRLTSGESLRAGFLAACAGLQADRVARMAGLSVDFAIVPYRGEYYRLADDKSGIVRHLIYPVPDPELPFLGVHLTRMVDGSVTVGPNAVQGWKREGYGHLNFSARDTLEMLSFPGFWRVTGRQLRPGLAEARDSLWKRGYLSRVRKYCPSIGMADLRPHPAGVRAQAVRRDGGLVHDFLFAESPRSLHVCNAPSPAATSALPIARHVVGRALSIHSS